MFTRKIILFYIEGNFNRVVSRFGNQYTFYEQCIKQIIIHSKYIHLNETVIMFSKVCERMLYNPLIRVNECF